MISLVSASSFGLNIFYSSQDMIKDWAERKATCMFSPLHMSVNLSVTTIKIIEHFFYDFFSTFIC